jgi:hypothetical protein
MADMRPSALHKWQAPAYSHHCRRELAILPDGDRPLAVVPLWKVIAGPRAGKLEPDPQGSGFLFAIGDRCYPNFADSTWAPGFFSAQAIDLQGARPIKPL